MTLRERINRSPVFSIVVVSILILVMIVIVARQRRANSGGVRVSKLYYSNDDGQTYFADSSDLVPPFDHEGKQAYQAYVFQCGDGKPFVGTLARYTDAAKAKLAALDADPEKNGLAITDLMNSGIEVKKPGDSKWVPLQSGPGMAIMLPKCPDGGKVVGVTP